MIPQIKWGMLAFKILGPITVIIGLIVYHNIAVGNSYNDGVSSRDTAFAELTKKYDDAAADVVTLTEDLSRCRDTKNQAEADVTSLKGKLAAQADEAKAALKLQAETFAATQAATSRALNTLAENTKVADIDYAGILEQLKGVNYDVDENTGRCIIRGGGRVLSNAAKGKIGQ
jgi:hypothetical protein